MTDNENTLIAYALLDEVNALRESIDNDMMQGARPETIARDLAMLTADIARAQVYATLATVQPRPSRDDVAAAVHGALERVGIDTPAPETAEVTDAIMGLL